MKEGKGTQLAGVFIGAKLHGTYQLVLVRGDSGEHGLREDERAELFTLKIDNRTIVAFEPSHEVDAWLVAVHGIQYDLNAEAEADSEKALSKRMPEKF